MKRSGIFAVFILFVIVFLSILQIVVSSSLSTTGIELAKIDDRIKFYQKENAMLKENLLTASSLINIESKANLLGFVEGKSEITLTTPNTLALKQ